MCIVNCRDKTPRETADLFFINEKIITIDENNPQAEALAIKGDKIVAVGSNKVIKTYIDKRETKIIDLKGKLVLPGFNDSHVHFIFGGYALMTVSLDKVTSFDEIQRRIKEKVEEVREPHEINKRAVKLAMKEAARSGVTSVHNLDGDFEGLFQELLDKNELTVRVYTGGYITNVLEKLKEYKKWKIKLKNNNHMLKFGVLKGFIDESLGSSTALLTEPYKNDPSTCGISLMTQEELNEIISLNDKENFQIAIHAIGDKGCNMVLSAYEESIKRNGKRDARHRIEYATTLIPEDIPRFKKLAVIASVQPVFDPSYGKIIQSFFEDRLGERRAKFTNAWNTLSQADAILAFGTDWPVESLNPMEGIYSAVTRKSIVDKTGSVWLPNERLPIEKAIECYTLGSAYASFEEDIKGSLQKRKTC